jgi:hypothetical protein
MIYRIPNENKALKQSGDSDVYPLANIAGSFNLDLTGNVGRIRVSPRGILVDGTVGASTLSNMGTPVAFEFYQDQSGNERIYTIAGARMFYSEGDPTDVFVQDATASTPTTLTAACDLKVFKDALYIGGLTTLYKYDGSAWSTVTSNADGGNCQFCVYGGRLYGTQAKCEIFSIDSSGTFVEPSGPPNTNLYTLDLVSQGGGIDDNNIITTIRASTDRIWVATMNTADSISKATGCRGKVYEWNGVDLQTSKTYELDSLGALAMVIKDNIPWILDADGRLLFWNGSAFVQPQDKPRLPIPFSQYLLGPSVATTTQRFIHPRGMVIGNNGNIQILINNQNNVTSQPIENLPSGVWEYIPGTGLVHTRSISLWDVQSSSTRTDFAQNRIAEVGALFPSKSANGSANNGDMLAGVKYYTDATTTASGVFTFDSNDTKSKVGYFITTWLESSEIQDKWSKVFVKHKRFLDSSDKISVKYRTYESTAIEGTITWTSTTTFTSTVDLSTVEVGDEVEIMRGKGGGQCEHITAISNNAGTYTVTLENAVTGASSGTATARFQKWIKAGDLSTQGLDYGECPIGKNAPRIQLKVVMYFTGKDELHEIQPIRRTFTPSS